MLPFQPDSMTPAHPITRRHVTACAGSSPGLEKFSTCQQGWDLQRRENTGEKVNIDIRYRRRDIIGFAAITAHEQRLSRATRAWATPMYRTTYDPDGCPTLVKLRRRI